MSGVVVVGEKPARGLDSDVVYAGRLKNVLGGRRAGEGSPTCIAFLYVDLMRNCAHIISQQGR